MEFVYIQGEEWEICEENAQTDSKLEFLNGYCDTSVKQIVIDDMSKLRKESDAKKDLKQYKRQVTRHELLHAFMYESGLEMESWAANEEMVDFFAIQFPKLAKLFKDAKVDK